MQALSMKNRLARRAASGAFTLVELLVVIAIIAILAALTLAVATQVAQGGKKGYTENILRTLDQAYTAWAMDKQDKAPRYMTDDDGTQFPIIDAVYMGQGAAGSPPGAPATSPPVEPSLALLIAEMTKSDSSSFMLKDIDAKLMYRFDPAGKKANGSPATYRDNPLYSPAMDGLMIGGYNGVPHFANGKDRGLKIMDAWGSPIRVVMPAYSGGFGPYVDPTNAGGPIARSLRAVPVAVNNKPWPPPPAAAILLWFRRSYQPVASAPGDADEGTLSGAVPYFYSSGPDGDPGTRSDNVYSTKPSFPAETKAFNNN